MSARVLNIDQKVKPIPVFPADPGDFVLSEGESIDPQVVVTNPNISLYCLDDDNREALFVETPPEVDLSQFPFYYMAQYDQAQRVIAVPYETFHQLADDQPFDASKLTLIYSVGRCGSTLISAALNAVNGMVSLSEPDVYTQIHVLRYVDRSRDAELSRLLESSTKLLCKGGTTYALKFRSFCILIGDLIAQAFPDTKNLFLYRNAETWAQSINSVFTPIAVSELPPEGVVFMRSMAPLAPGFIERHGREPLVPEMFALLWLSVMDAYLNMRDQGVPFLALRFEDIRTKPQDVLAGLFTYCDLPLADVEIAYGVFAKDSQEGSMLSQSSRDQGGVAPFGAAEYAQVREVLAEYPVVKTPDYVAPDTLRLDFDLGDTGD